MKSTPAALLSVWLGAGLAAQQQPQQPADAPAQRLFAALARFGALAPVRIDMEWSARGKNVHPFIGTASGACTAEVMFLQSGEHQWLVSARAQLVRIGDQWLGPKSEGPPPGCIPALLAAIRAQPPAIVHREVGTLDDRPVDLFALSIAPGETPDFGLLARVPDQRFENCKIGVRAWLRPQPGRSVEPRAVDVAIAIDPAAGEVRGIRMLYRRYARGQQIEPTGWAEALPVRPGEPTEAGEVVVRFGTGDPPPMPRLDPELRTRLMLGPQPKK